MKLKFKILYALFLIFLLLPACKPKPEAAGLLATVNGVTITEDDLHMRLHAGQDDPEARERVLKEIIIEELLYQKGLKLGLDRDPKYRNAVTIMEQRLKDFKRSEMARRISNSRIAATVEVTYEDVKKYYAEHKPEISADLHLIVVQFADEGQARDALRRIKAGAPLETVAKELYPGVSNGKTVPWDRGFLHWNEIPVDLTETIYGLKTGDISRVLSGKRTGVCIVRLVDRRANPAATFEKMSPSIMNNLRDVRVIEAYDRYVEDLKKASKIVNFVERRKGS